MLRLFKAITLAAFLWAFASAQASPPKVYREPTSYCAYDLGPDLVPEAINNRNQIAGTAVLGDLAQAFVWDGERGVRLLGLLPQAAISVGSDINNLGQVVGYSGGGGILQQAFVWDERNGMQRVMALGGASATAMRINDVGDIIGVSSTAEGGGERMYFQDHNGEAVDFDGNGDIPFHLNVFSQVGYSRQTQQFPQMSDVFIWHPKTGEQRLGSFPENRLVLPAAMNDRMDIVGSVLGDDGLIHAMVWTPRKGTKVLSPGEEGFSHAVDVNEGGAVVGWFGASGIDPFIWTRKSGLRDLMTLLDPTTPIVPRSYTIEPRGINDLGWIALYGHDSNGPHPHAYVLTPKFRHDDTPCAPSLATSESLQ